MSSAAEILVVILSAALAIFIILGIALFISLIKITKRINEATKNIENITSGVDEIVQNVAKTTSPIIIGKTLYRMFNKFNKKGKQ